MICFKPKNDNINLELNLDIKLYYCGTGDCENNFSWGPGIKDHYKLHYIHSGQGIFKVGDETYHLTKGQGFLVCPNVLVSYKPEPGEEWNYSWVAFNGLNAEYYLNRAGLSAASPIFDCSEAERIDRCFHAIFESVRSEKSMDLKSLSAFYDLLSIVIDNAAAQDLNVRYAANHRNSTNHKEVYVKQAIEFIDTNYSRKIHIEEIADYVGINRKYLCQVFSEVLNLSPQSYLINFRLKKACDLLAGSNLSVNEISNSVGYGDPYLFSKVFKKFRGASPKAYRVSHG